MVSKNDRIGKTYEDTANAVLTCPGLQHIDHVAYAQGALVDGSLAKAKALDDFAIPVQWIRISQNGGHGTHPLGANTFHDPFRDSITNLHFHFDVLRPDRP